MPLGMGRVCFLGNRNSLDPELAGYAGDEDLEGMFRKQVMALTVTLARSLLPPEQRRARLKGSPRSVEENSFFSP